MGEWVISSTRPGGSSLSLVPVSDPFDATADRGSRALLPELRVRQGPVTHLSRDTEVRFRS